MLMARLAKKNPDTILCGLLDCRGQLAEVVFVTRAKDGAKVKYIFVPGIFSKKRDAEGVLYEVAPHVRNAALRGQQGLTADPKARRRAGRRDTARDHLSLEDLPVRIRCPRWGCPWISWVTTDLLTGATAQR